MNITEYGKLMGVGKTTIYRRISQAGLDLSDLRGEDGQLTDAGLSTLSALLDGTPGTSVGHSNSHQEDVPPGRSTSGTVEDLKTQLETTRAELAAAQARINELLQQAADRERDHAEAWRKYAEVQQQIEAQRLLTAGTGDKPGLFARIRAKLTGKDKQTGDQQ